MIEKNTATAHSEPPLLELDGTSVMRDQSMILRGLSLRVLAGQHTAIVGPNGSGKSTLVKLIARQLYPMARHDGRASLRIFGRERWNVNALRRHLGIVSPALQRDFTTDAPLEVFDAVLSAFFAARGMALQPPGTDAMRALTHRALAEMQADHLIGRQMESLSTGEARRVLIARALVHQPRALLLDEPCTGLDMASRCGFLETLRAVARGGVTLVLVTHHVEEIIPEVVQVALLRSGELIKLGSREDTLTDDALTATFGLPVKVERHGNYFAAATL